MLLVGCRAPRAGLQPLTCCRYQELETKYNEQLRQNQITIHIKDLETREKIKELTEKFALESESERQRYELLQQQKVETEMEFSERMKGEEARSSSWACFAGSSCAHARRKPHL